MRVPISKSSWWSGIRDGRFPAGIKLAPKTTVWRSSDIDALIASLAVGAGR
jgi:predicted DNA-binding transcriptional regulator AlpA